MLHTQSWNNKSTHKLSVKSKVYENNLVRITYTFTMSCGYFFIKKTSQNIMLFCNTYFLFHLIILNVHVANNIRIIGYETINSISWRRTKRTVSSKWYLATPLTICLHFKVSICVHAAYARMLTKPTTDIRLYKTATANTNDEHVLQLYGNVCKLYCKKDYVFKT